MENGNNQEKNNPKGGKTYDVLKDTGQDLPQLSGLQPRP